MPVKVRAGAGQTVISSGSADAIWGEGIQFAHEQMGVVEASPETNGYADALGTMTAAHYDQLAVDDLLAATASADMASTVAYAEDPAATLLVPAEGLAVTDAQLADLLTPDDAAWADALGAITAAATEDSLTVDDFARIHFEPYGPIAASGTPDSDVAGDSWVDQANTGTNHGTETTAQIKTAVLNDARWALIEFDFTIFSGVTATTPGSGQTDHTLRVYLKNSNALTAMTATFDFAARASRWFTESTVTWSNTPTYTNLFTLSKTVTANTPGGAFYNITLTDSQLNQLLGNWVLVVAKCTTATGSYLLDTRENGGGSGPRWYLTLTP